MFNRKGQIIILNDQEKIDEDELTLEVIDAYADDIEVSDEVFEIYTDPTVFEEVRDQLIASGYDIEESEITLFPETLTELPEEQSENVLSMIAMLAESEDVHALPHNSELQT